MLKVQRLAEYERYLGQEARNLSSEGVKSGAVLQRGQLEGDLHRIQELFPNDNLRLHEQDVLTTVKYVLLKKKNFLQTRVIKITAKKKITKYEHKFSSFL